MFDRSRMHEGMTVRSASGEKLGKLVSLGGDSFEFQKGAIFKDRYSARFDDIADIRDDELILAEGEFIEAGEETGGRWTAGGAAERMKLHEEEVHAERREVPAGELRLRKEVDTEQRTISVPVTRERVRVEREPAYREASPGEARFEEEEIRIPLKEEEVEIHKRPVVKEEVRVAKAPETETRSYEEEVRSERAVVSTEGDVRKLDEPERK